MINSYDDSLDFLDTSEQLQMFISMVFLLVVLEDQTMVETISFYQ
jgi:hypothetical protein